MRSGYEDLVIKEELIIRYLSIEEGGPNNNKF